MQKSPAQQRIWDTCQPRPQTQSILCFGAVFNKDHVVEEGVGLVSPVRRATALGPWSVRACFLTEQLLSPTNSVARCQLTASCAQAVKTARRGARGQPGSTSSPPVGQEEAAPSQKSAEEKVVQVKTGPSRYLAETSWRGTLWIW